MHAVARNRLQSPARLLGAALLSAALVLVAGACSDAQEIPPLAVAAPDTVAIDATVQFLDIEGGCWALEVSSAVRLEPVNLPDEFRVDALRVRVTLTGVQAVSVCMIGPTVKVLQIERL